MKYDIIIIGAGIGGLTTAMLLQQKGFKPAIYESAGAIQPVGAGIIIANNAMQIFKKAGISDSIEKAGQRVSLMKITDERMTVLSLMDLLKYEKRYGVCNIAIHRAALQKILAEQAGFENIHLSKRLVNIENKESYVFTFEDGSTGSSDIVIGADGIKSTVRSRLFNTGDIRDTRQLCWRGIGDWDCGDTYQNEAIEMWGKGKRFGFVKISATKIYWYAVINQWLVKGNNNDLTDLFREFHGDVSKIIAATAPQDIFRSNIIDLKPVFTWARGKACLIGDAAHATTPNLGQGACQAIEDAYALAELLASGKSMEDAFVLYEKLRMKKAHDIVKRSRAVGKISHIENSTGIWLRNTLMKILPASANNKLLDKIFDISYIR